MIQKREGVAYRLWLGASAIIALGLYLLGATVFLPLLIGGLLFWRLPVPRFLRSIVGRLIVAFVASNALLQLAVTVQFFVWPASDFRFVAVLFAFFGCGVVVFLGQRPVEKPAWITRYDVAGLLIALLFVAPFAPLLAGHNSVQKIVSIAGLQSPDAGHHYDFIGDMMYGQHLDHSGYPKSFHAGMGFLQDAFVGPQDKTSWQTNVVVFFGQYVLFGGLLAMMLGYVLLAWFEQMTRRRASKLQTVLMAGALALPLQLLTLWPFVEHGFLNYFYVVAVLVLAILYAHDMMARKAIDNRLVVSITALLLSATMTWPLVVPATLLAVLLLLRPIRVRALLLVIWRRKVASLLVALQIVPLIMQALIPGTTDINDQGDLRTLAVFALLGGLAAAFAAARMFAPRPRRVLVAALVPFVILASGIWIMQLIVLHEPRYFTVKVALLVETLTLTLGVAALFAASVRRKAHLHQLVFCAFVPLFVVVALVSATGKPFEDVRNLFRNETRQTKPDYYDHDVAAYAALGVAGEINYFNSTLLHYNQQNHTLVAHAFLPQAVQYMKYSRSAAGIQALNCHKHIFSNLAYGTFTEAEQKDLVALVRSCADDAHKNGQRYYIITDETSLPQVRATIGEGRGIVYVSS